MLCCQKILLRWYSTQKNGSARGQGMTGISWTQNSVITIKKLENKSVYDIRKVHYRQNFSTLHERDATCWLALGGVYSKVLKNTVESRQPEVLHNHIRQNSYPTKYHKPLFQTQKVLSTFPSLLQTAYHPNRGHHLQ